MTFQAPRGPRATRRDVFAGLAIAAWTVPVIAHAQSSAGMSWAPKALSLDQARTLSAACEAIIPETDTPGAIAAGCGFISVPFFVMVAAAMLYVHFGAQPLVNKALSGMFAVVVF